MQTHILTITIRISSSDLTNTIIYTAMYENTTSGQVFYFYIIKPIILPTLFFGYVNWLSSKPVYVLGIVNCGIS
jgi:hypothetical protein